ncbi:hypothetical protein CHS0354_019856 [Potamilus streckersoni]|uniref:RING-type domain-containing protein n=1 Tax=Potamilus streckersoni TaxID=2493646 RepID=A0AAE0VP19_9BIVA|nr:hypothetical protein CHS0354_019856 [Potamilus streckersoni]
MNRDTRLKITELNPHLICVLCGGYYIDATTLVECLHTFCKSCIVNYLQTSKYCPVCSALVHKTKPLLRLRADTALQDLVYKLVPGLFQDEMRRRRKYYKEKIESGEVKESSLNETQGKRVIFSKDELISLALQLSPDGTPPYKPGKTEQKTESVDRRYLLCPGSITVGHLKKFLRMKYNLCDRFQIDVFHTDEALSDTYTLIDIAYIYLWRRQGPLRLYYTVYTNPAKRFKAEEVTVISAEKDCSDSVKTEHDVEYFGISEATNACNKDIDVDTGNGSMINESKTVQLQESSLLENSVGSNVKFNASDVGETTNEVEGIANVDSSNTCVGFNSSQTNTDVSCLEASENENSLEISADGSSFESCTDHNCEQPLIMDLEFSPEEQISDRSVETSKSNADGENNCILSDYLKETDKAPSLVSTKGCDKETVVCDKHCVTAVKHEQIFSEDSEENERTVNEKKENNLDYKTPTQSLSESSTSTTKPFKPNSPRRDFLIPYNTEPTRVPFYMHSLYSSMQRYTQSAKQSSESSGHRDTEQPLKRKTIYDEPSVKQYISSASRENCIHGSLNLARTSQSNSCDFHKLCTSSNTINSKTVPNSRSLTISVSSPSQSGEDVSSSTSPSIQSCRSPVSSKAVQAAIISYSSQTQTTPYKSHSKTNLKEKHGRSKSPSHDSEPRHCEKLQLTKQHGPNSNGIWVISRVVNGEPVKKKEPGSSTSSSSSVQTFEVKPSVRNEQKKDEKQSSDKNDSKFKYSQLHIPKYCIGQGNLSKQNKASLSTYRAMVHSTPTKPKWNIPSSKQEHKSSPTQFNGHSGQNKAVTLSSNLSTTGRMITASPCIQTTSPSSIGDISGRLYSHSFTHGQNLFATMASHYSRLVNSNNNSISFMDPMHIIQTIENPMTAHMNSMCMTHVPSSTSFINEQNCLNLSKNAQSGRHTANSQNIYNLQSLNTDNSSVGSSQTSSDKSATKSPTTQKKDNKEKRSIHHIISEITERRNQKEKSVSSPEGIQALSPTGNGQHATSSNGHEIKNGQVDKYEFTDDDEMPVTQPLLHFKPEPFYTDRKGVV